MSIIVYDHICLNNILNIKKRHVSAVFCEGPDWANYGPEKAKCGPKWASHGSHRACHGRHRASSCRTETCIGLISIKICIFKKYSCARRDYSI